MLPIRTMDAILDPFGKDFRDGLPVLPSRGLTGTEATLPSLRGKDEKLGTAWTTVAK